jgi:lycopene cyclase domain-containing protein
MSLTYLLINLAIISVPLCYTAHKRIGYYRQLPAVGFSILVVSSCYLVWDIFVTARGEWSFNSRYLTGIKIVNLPLEEILFFITVPYSCLFIYEALLQTTKNSCFKIPTAVVISVIVLLTAASILFYRQGYTMKALASCAFFIAAALALDRSLLKSKQYWLWLAVCYIPFLIFNSVLTALPVVEYNSAAIWGVRVGTIPLEDFFYNFSMLSFYVLFYRVMRNKTAK